ncbi:MAG: glycosyltransferase family 8 protein [Microcoleus sp.]
MKSILLPRLEPGKAENLYYPSPWSRFSNVKSRELDFTTDYATLFIKTLSLMSEMYLSIVGDRNYILGIAAILKSIELNATTDPNQSVNITVVSTGFNTEQQEKLQKCCKYKIEWQEVKDNYNELMSLSGSKLTYARLEPEKYTKATERLIWLDSDMIVLDSLEPLWNLDFQGMPIAAALNVWGNPNNAQDKNPYFNAGLLVFNMKLWLEEKLSEKMIADAKVNLWSDCDQGTSNSVLAGRWYQLDQIWNNPDTEDTSTKVMHFISRPKPWESPEPNKLWMEMLSQTPFKDELAKIQNNSDWLLNLKLKYARWEPWVRHPIKKIKSYLKNRSR